MRMKHKDSPPISLWEAGHASFPYTLHTRHTQSKAIALTHITHSHTDTPTHPPAQTPQWEALHLPLADTLTTHPLQYSRVCESVIYIYTRARKCGFELITNWGLRFMAVVASNHHTPASPERWCYRLKLKWLARKQN